jgi:hypothetical protein
MALRGKWTRGDVGALSASQVRALRKNALRARDDQVVSWCDEVLHDFPQPARDTVVLAAEIKKQP